MKKHHYLEIADAHESTAQHMRTARPDDLASHRCAEALDLLATHLREMAEEAPVEIKVTDQAPQE